MAIESIRVYAKAQNRTALGIMHSYMLMYPHATIDDLRKAFPNSINPDKGVQEIFIFSNEKGTSADWDGYFKEEDELLTMGDGKKVSVVKMWTKPSLDRLMSHAKTYGIVVAEFVEAEKGFGKKGSFRLEYLNGWTPPAPEKKKSLLWLWILLALLLGLLLFFLLKPKDTQVIEKVVEKEVIVRDTVYVQQLEEIEENFNAAQFEKGKSELNDDAKLALHDLAKLMKQNANIRLSIEGHTSSEGDEAFNQKLSEDRAKAAVDFLVEKEGIDPNRLTAVGKGSSEPVDPNNAELNRRTEFIVLE